MTHSEQRQQGGIERFDVCLEHDDTGGYWAEATPTADGDYVRFSDHQAALEEQRERAEEAEEAAGGLIAGKQAAQYRLEQAEQQRDELLAEVEGAADAMDDLADEPAAAHKARAAFRVSSHLLRAAVKSASVQPPSGESDA